MKYSTVFLGLQVSNPDNASQFQERSFWARRPPCNFVTNGLTRTVYQNIKLQGLLKNVTKHEECRTIIKLNHWMNIFNINSITGYGPLPSRVWSIERSSQSSEVPTNMVRKLQLSNAISEKQSGAPSALQSQKSTAHKATELLQTTAHDSWPSWLSQPTSSMAERCIRPLRSCIFKVEGGGVWWGTESCGQ